MASGGRAWRTRDVYGKELRPDIETQPSQGQNNGAVTEYQGRRMRTCAFFGNPKECAGAHFLEWTQAVGRGNAHTRIDVEGHTGYGLLFACLECELCTAVMWFRACRTWVCEGQLNQENNPGQSCRGTRPHPETPHPQ
eukprot:EG_transcript_13939